MRWFCLICLLIGLAGCTAQPAKVADSGFSLPPSGSLPCCEQHYEQLEISVGGESFSMTSVAAVSDEGLVILLLDALGQRQLTITYRDQQIDVDTAHELPASMEPKWLLAAYMLRNAPPDSWRYQGSPWELLSTEKSILLKLGGETTIEIRRQQVIKSEAIKEQTSREAQVFYPELGMEVKISRIMSQPL